MKRRPLIIIGRAFSHLPIGAPRCYVPQSFIVFLRFCALAHLRAAGEGGWGALFVAPFFKRLAAGDEKVLDGRGIGHPEATISLDASPAAVSMTTVPILKIRWRTDCRTSTARTSEMNRLVLCLERTPRSRTTRSA